MASSGLVNDTGRDGPRRGGAGGPAAGSTAVARPSTPSEASATRCCTCCSASVLLFELMPFYFIVVTAFKSTLQIQQVQNMFWPSPWTLEHFRYMLFEKPFLTWYGNTILVAVVSTTVSVLAAALGGYALARLKWRGVGRHGHDRADRVPDADRPLMFIPLYYILVQLKLQNTLMALMVTYPSVILPFATWLMMGYYRSIPEELEDAAMIDGCNRFGAFFRVVLPLVRPALLAVTMFAVTQCVERVPVRLHVHPQLRDLHPPGRAPGHDHRRRPAVGRADGRLADDGAPGRGHLHARPAVHGGRPDGWQREGVSRSISPVHASLDASGICSPRSP